MPFHAVSLRCDQLSNPLGIHAPPRLSWKIAGDLLSQSAYQIEATRAGEVVWDSGKVSSDQSLYVPYGGPEPASRERVEWRVRVWNEAGGVSEWSEPAWFEMGLKDPSDWQAQWIGSEVYGGPRTTAPCPRLRRAFSLEQPVVSARAYVTALGLYTLSINGEKVGNDIFTPGWTDYRKRVQVQVYDVTSMFEKGENVLAATLGDGWYCGHIAWRDRGFYGDRPKFLLQLELTLADGTRQTVVSDGSWKTATGPILESDLLMGEAYDARRETPGWDRAGFDDSRWQSVSLFERPEIALDPMLGPPVREVLEIECPEEPREIGGWPNSKWIFDLGQNMVGRVRLKVKGEAGRTVRLRYAEMLDNGALYTAALRSARATDYYTMSGDPNGEVYEPTFTFHGFRYVEVTGLAEKPTKEDLVGVVLMSDTPVTGTFECSDPLVTQLQKNVQWGQRGNFLEVPTDCPQRDERLGWTGDAQVFIRTACFNMDVSGFFDKWQRDIEDSQSAEGAVPPVVPHAGLGDDGGPAWADAAVICPWTIWQCYGDKRPMERHYESLKRFVTYLQTVVSRDHIRSYAGMQGFMGFGDWLSTKAETPIDLIGTAFLAHSARLLAEIAAELGHAEDATAMQKLFEDARRAFVRRFVTEGGLVASGSQTSYVLALHFDLLPENLRKDAAQQLVDDIGRRGWHLSTGFVGTPYINHVLTAAGRNDVAFRLLMQKTWPSWLYPVTVGATTIWERWDGWTHDKGFQDVGMNSFNHYAYGAIGDWLYRVVAGIDLLEPGYKKIRLRPTPGGEITWARASFDSPYGVIESDWRIEDGTFHYRVVVPPNTTAEMQLPGATEVVSLKPGSHTFSCPAPATSD